MFTEKFDKFVCDGDTIACEVDGLTITARVEFDDTMGPPWEEHDGHGVVSEWRPLKSKKPSERVLHEDRGSARFYDWQQSIERAKRDGWDAPPYGEGTAGERAHRAVQRDFDSLKAWCNDEWHWCCVVLGVSKGGIEIDENAASLGGIEVNHPHNDEGNDYLTEVANEMLDEAVEAGKKALEEMLRTLAE